MTGEVEVRNSEAAVGQPMTTAGFLRRLVATYVDGLVFAPLTIVIFTIPKHPNLPTPDPWKLALLSAVWIAYGIAMLGRYGWTLGMRALKVRVARADGGPVGYRTAAIRTWAYALPGILSSVMFGTGYGPGFLIIGAQSVALLWLIVDRNHQGYHDKIARTFVVRGVRAAAEAPPGGVVTVPAGPWLRAGKWAAFVTVSLFAMSPYAVVIALDVAAPRAERQVQAILAQLKAEGKPLTAAALVPPPIPDAENAALVYERAAGKLQGGGGSDVAFESLDNWLRGQPLGHGIAPDKLAELNPPPVGASADAQVFAVAKRRVEQNRDSLALLHKAAGMEKWRSPRKEGGGDLPRIPNARRSARLLALQAMVLTEGGDADGALRAAITPVYLSNFLDEPAVIVALVRMIMCYVGAEAVERVLFDSTPSADACRAAEVALAKAELRTALVLGLEGERASCLAAFDEVRNVPGYSSDMARLYLPPPGSPEPLRRVSALLGWFMGWRFAADELYYLTYMDVWIRQVRTPVFEQDPQVAARLQHLQPPDEWDRLYAIWHPLTALILPRMMNANPRVGENEAAVALARVALLLKVYRAERGAYPESLNDLEGYLGKELPLDPCSGKEFRYQREGRGFTLYSVGLDGVDDGGARPEKADPIPPLGSLAGGGKDIVWVCKE